MRRITLGILVVVALDLVARAPNPSRAARSVPRRSHAVARAGV